MSKKRTTRKSQGLRSRILEKQNSAQEQDVMNMMSESFETKTDEETTENKRVVDMSWAAAYLDDEWEKKYGSSGNYDTRVMKPIQPEQLGEKTENSIMFDLMADSMKGLEAGVNGEVSEMAESIGNKTKTEGEDLPESPLAVTQEYKAVSEETEFSLNLKAAIKELERKEEKQTEIAEENNTVIDNLEVDDISDDLDDIIKVRDAVTDKTIFSIEDAKRVREAASQMDLGDDLEEISKIRDAETDKTIVSIEDVKLVRDAAAQMEIAGRMFAAEKIRDAETDKTIVSLEDARMVRESAALLDIEDDVDDSLKIRDAVTDKTIVSIDELMEVREAAASIPETEEELEKTRRISIPQSKIRKAEKKNKKKNKKSSKNEKISEIDIEELIDAGTDFSDEEADNLLGDIIKDDKPVKKRREEVKQARRPRVRDEYYDEYEDDYYDRRPSRPSSRRGYREEYYVETKSPFRFVPLFLVIALCVFAFIAAKEVCFDNPVNSSDYSKVIYTIDGGVDTKTLSEDLHALGLIENPLVFRLRCLLYGLSCKDGTYELSPCYSTEKIVNILSGYEYIDE